MGYTTACDYAFGLFVVTWFVTRHIFYPMILWSVYAQTPTPGCYFSDGSMVPATSTSEFNALRGGDMWHNVLKAYTDQNGPVCWNSTLRYSFLSLLLVLQVIMIMWFITIATIVYKVIRGQPAEDARSDDEGDDEEMEVEEEIANVTHPINAIKSGPEWVPVEEEVGVESLSFTRKSSPGVRSYKRSSNRSGSRASGISIPGHGDRKELLGRIGCDKPA